MLPLRVHQGLGLSHHRLGRHQNCPRQVFESSSESGHRLKPLP